MTNLWTKHAYKLDLWHESTELVHQNLNHWFSNNLVFNNSLTYFWVNYAFTSNNTFSAVCFLCSSLTKAQVKVFLHLCNKSACLWWSDQNIPMSLLWFAVNSNVLTGGDLIHTTLMLMIHEQWAQWAFEDIEHLCGKTLAHPHTHTQHVLSWLIHVKVIPNTFSMHHGLQCNSLTDVYIKQSILAVEKHKWLF